MTTNINNKYRSLLEFFNLEKWFNEEVMKIIEKINYNPIVVTNEEFQKIYDIMKDSDDTIYLLSQTQNTPYKILKDIVAQTTDKEILLDLLKRENLEKDEIKQILSKLDPSSIIECFEDGILNHCNPFSNTVIELMIAENLSYNGLELAFTKNQKKLQEILAEDIIDEHLTTAIANNIYVNDKIRNEAFDLGVNDQKINNKTIHMIKKLYNSIVEATFDYIPEEKEKQNVLTQNIKSLKQLINTKKLSESYEIDLVNRLKPQISNQTINEHYRNEILKEMAKNTNSKTVLQMIYNYNIQEVNTYIYENPIVAKELLEQEVNATLDIMSPKKLSKHLVAYKTAAEKICDICKKVTLGTDSYNRILETDDQQLINSIIISPHTPPSILKDIAKSNIIQNKDFAQIVIKLNSCGMKKYVPEVIQFVIDKQNGQPEYTYNFISKNQAETEILIKTLSELNNVIIKENTMEAIRNYITQIANIIKTKSELLSMDKIFCEDADGIAIIKKNHDLRSYSHKDYCEQLENVRTQTIKKIKNIIINRCGVNLMKTNDGTVSLNEVDTYLTISGYAELYNACTTIEKERAMRQFEKENDLEETI